MLELRDYQQRSLDDLERYFGLVTQHGARTAFVLQTDRPYHEVRELPGLPYVCLRIPTGGGKTLMACHALGIAASNLLQAERAVCLWLVPSNTIRDQTLEALKDREHPYRQAIDVRFGGQVEVMDLAGALYVQRGTLDGAAAIIVSTLQAFRVEDTEGRKVYEAAGALQHHFSGLLPGLENGLEKGEGGAAIPCLANVLRLRRPVVIVDEAHNARTPLSFDTLARFSPSCIIEFTATPQVQHDPQHGLFASNVLAHVSAAELKAEEMVKLPIKLRTRSDWKEALGDALETQRTLEQLAREEQTETGDYLRPIVLFQAQPRRHDRSTLTFEVVKKSLLEDFRVPEAQIAIATGDTREIDGVDLFEPSCQVRFIITVQALKEGWDCPFAYVLCSVADISSTRAVEQILGRILRMPGARRRRHPDLNCAYAFAASPHFAEAAAALKDALIENGFQRLEAKDFVIPQEELPFDSGLFAPASEQVSAPPDLSNLPPALRERVSYEPAASQFTVSGAVTAREEDALRACFTDPEDQAAVKRICQTIRGYPGAQVPAPAREPFHVPQLAVRTGGQLEILEESHFLASPWSLADSDATLTEGEFPSQPPAPEEVHVDVDESGRIVQFVQQVQEQLALLAPEPGWTVPLLVAWLDREIPHQDIPQTQSTVFIRNLVVRLMEDRGLTVEQLGRQKMRLRSAVEDRIEKCRCAQHRQAFNALLQSVALEVSPDLVFSYEEDRYASNSYYDGTFQFAKHYFPKVGELKREGEEFDCAVFVDSRPQVKHWVRNLERKENSFWLQTATDRFYPDFVALLEDGRILVVEYKGADRWSNDDSREKRELGEIWARLSNGCCLFVMPNGPNWEAIAACISEGAT